MPNMSDQPKLFVEDDGRGPDRLVVNVSYRSKAGFECRALDTVASRKSDTPIAVNLDVIRESERAMSGPVRCGQDRVHHKCLSSRTIMREPASPLCRKTR